MSDRTMHYIRNLNSLDLTQWLQKVQRISEYPCKFCSSEQDCHVLLHFFILSRHRSRGLNTISFVLDNGSSTIF
jgi:hypothetical protein